MARVKYHNKETGKWEYADSAYNLSQGNTVEVDTTLSKEGKAADAKAVGESLSQKIPMPVDEAGEVISGESNQVLTINQDGAGSWEYPLIIDATKTEGYQHVINKSGIHQELLCIDIAKPILGIYRMSNYQDTVVYPYVRIVNGDTVLVSSMSLGVAAAHYIDVFEVNDRYVQFRVFVSNGHCTNYMYDIAENSWTERKILYAASYVDFNLSQKITVPNTASIGQVLTVKAVDENGKPTEWETVEIPSGGSNQPLTFTGAVNATYDGSEAVSVEIPAGGGGGAELTTLIDETLTEAVVSIDYDFGKAYKYLEVYIYTPKAAGNTTNNNNIWLQPNGIGAYRFAVGSISIYGSFMSNTEAECFPEGIVTLGAHNNAVKVETKPSADFAGGIQTIILIPSTSGEQDTIPVGTRIIIRGA